jgi:hypothetical protein
VAQRALTAARIRYRLTPWWVKVGVIWLGSRLITTALLLFFANAQEKNSWTGAHPGYFAFSQLWDSTWYHIVAVSGYPSQLPVTATGQVAENAWAFLPAYPMLVRFFMVVTGLPWEIVSVSVSLLFSLATALVFFRLMRLVLPAGTAMFSVVLLCVAPLSPIFQVSYAESMYCFFLALALFLLLQRRYALMFPVIAIMALTRPSGLAFALALALHVAHRWFTRVRDPFPVAERMLAVGLAAFSLAMGLAWPGLAWLVTGSASAYTDTELAWRSAYIGSGELSAFVPWVQGAEFWAGQWHLGGFGIPLLVLVVAVFIAVLFSPPVRRLGPDLRIWCASYALYLLAVFFPQSSTFRLLLPMFPLLGALAQPKSGAFRVSLVVLSIAGQVGWLWICWWVNGYDWTPP